MSKTLKLKYHHLGIPTNKPIEGEVYLKDYKIYHYGYEESEYGIEWMRYEQDCQLPEIVKTMPHIAFEVDDIYAAIRGKKVIILQYKNDQISGESNSFNCNGLSATVYPNPFTSDFTLVVNAESQDPVQVEIFELTGKLLQKIGNIQPDASVIISTDLPEGFYILNIRQGSQNQKIKLVKNR